MIWIYVRKGNVILQNEKCDKYYVFQFMLQTQTQLPHDVQTVYKLYILTQFSKINHILDAW